MGAVCHTGTGPLKDGKLPKGNEDIPGYAQLPAFSELLYVGNDRAAAFGSFDAVVSTCCPRDRDGRKKPALATRFVRFDDCRGEETAEQIHVARSMIVEGALNVAEVIADGKKTLVHCAYGQNRSCAVCCAYVIIYHKWSAIDAIGYVRARSRIARQYRGQDPIHNVVFFQILLDLEKDVQNGWPVCKPSLDQAYCGSKLPPPRAPRTHAVAKEAAPNNVVSTALVLAPRFVARQTSAKLQPNGSKLVLAGVPIVRSPLVTHREISMPPTAVQREVTVVTLANSTPGQVNKEVIPPPVSPGDAAPQQQLQNDRPVTGTSHPDLAASVGATSLPSSQGEFPAAAVAAVIQARLHKADTVQGRHDGSRSSATKPICQQAPTVIMAGRQVSCGHRPRLIAQRVLAS